jgi:hypothetical protein
MGRRLIKRQRLAVAPINMANIDANAARREEEIAKQIGGLVPDLDEFRLGVLPSELFRAC